VLAGRYTSLEQGILPLPTEGAWVSGWTEGASTETDVRRRVAVPSPEPDPTTP
jgi:hypothetical protein